MMRTGSPPTLSATQGVLSAQPRARAPIYGKLIDLCTYAALVLAAALSILSVQIPYESVMQRNSRSLCIVVLAIVLFVLIILEMILSFYQHRRRANERVSYGKLVEQFFGMMVVICSFGVAAVNYITYKYNYGYKVGYGFSVCQLAMSLLYTGIAIRNIEKQKAQVPKTTNEETTV